MFSSFAELYLFIDRHAIYGIEFWGIRERKTVAPS
jgi:hypothetical protein